MLKSKVKFIKNIDGYGLYLFKPSIFKLYYNKTEEWTPHKKLLTHKMHMLLFLIFGGYNILYLYDNNEVVGYLVYCKCRKWFL